MTEPVLYFWRTITQILCQDCLRYRNSAVLARLFGRTFTCDRCGRTN